MREGGDGRVGLTNWSRGFGVLGMIDDGLWDLRKDVMGMASEEGRFEIDVRAKARALSLRVRLRGALWPSSPVGTHPTCRPQTNASTKIRYSLQLRFRKLWLRIRGKHTNHRPTAPIPSTKPKWRRTLGNHLLQRSRTSEKKITSQELGRGNGFVDALGTSDRVVMAMHGVGMVCTVIVLVQLAGGARGLPGFVTVVTGLAIVGRVLFVNRCSSLGPGLQQLWHEAMSIGGVSLVPQALGAIFRPYLPKSGFTGSEGVMGICTLIVVLLVRYRRLPFKVMQFFGVVSAGIPAILVLWAPIVQLWTCLWSPAAANYMQILTGLLAVLSNCFLGYSQGQK